MFLIRADAFSEMLTTLPKEKPVTTKLNNLIKIKTLKAWHQYFQKGYFWYKAKKCTLSWNSTNLKSRYLNKSLDT